MLIGNGFFIWKLWKLYPFETTIAKLKSIDAKWVSIKVLDSDDPYNYTNQVGIRNGSPQLLYDAIKAFKAAGISVGGWGFLYTEGATQKAQAIGAVDMINRFGLEHWLIDAEDVAVVGANWKTDPNRGVYATQYMDNLNVSDGFPVALCTYRYPLLHQEFPYSQFLSHRRVTFNAPQVYWMMSTDAGAQVRKSYAQYSMYTNKPFCPMGATFTEHGWSPTSSQIKDFVNTSVNDLKVSGYGWWDLDEAVLRDDWFNATAYPGTVPEVPPVSQPILYDTYEVQASQLRVRDNIIPSKIVGKLPGVIYNLSHTWFSEPQGTRVTALSKLQDGNNRWIRVGQKQWMAEIYDGNIYLKKV